MKKMLIILAGLTAALIFAGCTSPTTTNTTPSAIVTANAQDLTATLDAQLSAHYTLVDNFTRISEANKTPVYSGSFQDTNGTMHSVTLYLANSTAEAQGQFEAQYVDIVAAPNAIVNANTSTHWAVTADDISVSGWVVQPNAAGPFALSLNVPYVLVSQDVKSPVMPAESAVPLTDAAA